MSKSRYYIKIKDKNIPVIIRNYKNFNKIRFFFRDNILNISKPKFYSINKIIKDYGEKLYEKYMEFISTNKNNIKHFVTGEKILYSGEFYNVVREKTNLKKISVSLDEKNKTLNIFLPKDLQCEDNIRENIVYCIKKLFKNNTTIIIQEKLENWSKKMDLEYTSFKVNDTSSKYGSCMPKSKRLFFSLRLVMLPDDIIDLIVVHELAHIVYPNHSKYFYNLIRKYIVDYDRKDKWLKENYNLIIL